VPAILRQYMAAGAEELVDVSKEPELLAVDEDDAMGVDVARSGGDGIPDPATPVQVKREPGAADTDNVAASDKRPRAEAGGEPTVTGRCV
jgi:hypothetical protein